MKKRERQERKRQQNTKEKKIIGMIMLLLVVLVIILIVNGEVTSPLGAKKRQANATQQTETTKKSSNTGKQQKAGVATIMASGDMLYHDVVYGSAFDGQTYDFSNDYEQITPLVSSADLALGDFEGTINPNMPLAGYPIFNAPEAVVSSIKNAGYDAIDLAHNHILDTGISGLVYTANAFQKAGVDTFGVNVPDDKILVKKVNGIRIAILGFSYGFNGIEQSISQSDYDKYLNDLTMTKVEKNSRLLKKLLT